MHKEFSLIGMDLFALLFFLLLIYTQLMNPALKEEVLTYIANNKVSVNSDPMAGSAQKILLVEVLNHQGKNLYRVKKVGGSYESKHSVEAVLDEVNAIHPDAVRLRVDKETSSQWLVFLTEFKKSNIRVWLQNEK